jgi:hypothetical protein
MKKFLSLVTLFSACFYAEAGIYKWVDENGEVIYSDKPRVENMKEHTPPSIQITPAIKPVAQPEIAEEAPVAVTNYTAFSITSPANDETIRNNAGNFTVTLKLAPPLSSKDGHYINLQIDGKTRVSRTSKLAIDLNFIDRGTHIISAEIRDPQGKLLKSSNSVSIHLHRQSQLQKNPNKPPAQAPATTPRQ